MEPSVLFREPLFVVAVIQMPNILKLVMATSVYFCAWMNKSYILVQLQVIIVTKGETKVVCKSRKR